MKQLFDLIFETNTTSKNWAKRIKKEYNKNNSVKENYNIDLRSFIIKQMNE